MGKMMYGHGHARAGARYRSVDVSTRVEGASAHRLVSILYDELLTLIGTAAGAHRQRDFSKRGGAQARAFAILDGLRADLDFDKGGDVAPMLASVYAEVRRLILVAGRENAPEKFDEARKLIAEIAAAWDAIG
jgi:flagellar secretion chaperone FliS